MASSVHDDGVEYGHNLHAGHDQWRWLRRVSLLHRLVRGAFLPRYHAEYVQVHQFDELKLTGNSDIILVHQRGESHAYGYLACRKHHV
jgi:hypothetical protein